MGDKNSPPCTGFNCTSYYVPGIGHNFSSGERACSICYKRFKDWKLTTTEVFAKRYKGRRVRVVSVIKANDKSIKLTNVPRPKIIPQPFGKIIGFGPDDKNKLCVLVEFEESEDRVMGISTGWLAQHGCKILIESPTLAWHIPMLHLKLADESNGSK